LDKSPQLGYTVAHLQVVAMAETSVVRARIDEATKVEAAAVLAAMVLSLYDAFRLMLKRVAAGKPASLLPSLTASG